MEGKIDMAARRQVTIKLRDAYCEGSKLERGRILDRVVEATGMGRSTARRMLRGPRLPAPKDQIGKRSVKPRAYGDDTRLLLEHVWLLMGMPCGRPSHGRSRSDRPNHPIMYSRQARRHPREVQHCAGADRTRRPPMAI